jgi:ATP-dependent Zn protease
LAGRAAEELEFELAGNGAGGVAGSGLAYGTRIAAAMVGSFGHGGPNPPLYLADHRETAEIIAYHHVRASVHQELPRAFDETARLLKGHRPALREVTECLMKYRRTMEMTFIESLPRPVQGRTACRQQK